MARILLVDDDPTLLDVLSLALDDAGHEVVTECDGVAALERMRVDRPQLVVCDVNMPRLDGFAVCRKLREQKDRTPFVMLTSRDSEIDEALGLELGADDYVAKPFSTRVLLARITALLRREAPRDDEEETIVRGPLEIRTTRMEVRWSSIAVPVTVSELRLLEALARKPGVVLGRNRLMELVRGDDSIVEARIIDTWVRRLRRKLQTVDPSFDRIETIVGAGYRWRDA